MKREPRLQFSDADLAEPKLEKPIKRVKKAEAKADKAQAKIPKKTVVKKERGFDPATGKVKTQLRFEEVDTFTFSAATQALITPSMTPVPQKCWMAAYSTAPNSNCPQRLLKFASSTTLAVLRRSALRRWSC